MRIEVYEINDKVGWRVFKYEFEMDFDQLLEVIKILEFFDLIMVD